MDNNILSLLFQEQCNRLESCTYHKGKGERSMSADALWRAITAKITHLMKLFT